jgi:hypothetical protein
MEELDNIHENGLGSFLEGLPLKFRVMNLQLSMDTQLEFMEMMGKLNEVEVDLDHIKENRDTLLSPEAPLEERKLLLAQLALVDDVEVMRELERYAATCPDDIRDFAQMAAYQSKLFLEASILGENQIVVASGLGGDGEKMRFFVALLSLNRKPFTEVQQQVVRKEVDYQLRQAGAVLESVTFEGGYAKVLALIPMRTNVQRLFEQGVNACNELGEFIDRHMVISTVKPLSAEELDGITTSSR